MRQVTIQRKIDAPRAAVWKTLADFPNIADWNSGITKSFAIGDSTEGVGARRHCDLKPMGGLDETVTGWSPEEEMIISIDQTKRLPIKRGLVTFSLAENTDDANATDMGLVYDYESRLSFLEPLVGGLLDKQLDSGFNGFLDDLAAASSE